MEYIDTSNFIGQDYNRTITKVEDCLHYFDEWEKMQQNLWQNREFLDSLSELHENYVSDVLAPIYAQIEQETQERHEEKSFGDKIASIEESNTLQGIEQVFLAVQVMKQQAEIINNQLRAINVSVRDKNAALLVTRSKLSMQGEKEALKSRIANVVSVAKETATNKLERVDDDDEVKKMPIEQKDEQEATKENTFEIAQKNAREKMLKEEEKKKKKYSGRRISIDGK